MGKFSNPNPNFTPNFNNSFSTKKINNGHVTHVDDFKSDDTPSFSRRVSYDISGYSKAELSRLRVKLLSELKTVRDLATRIENGSKKRPSPFAASNGVANGVNSKRFAGNSISRASQEVMKKCGTVLNKLMNQKAGIWFNSPVDAVGMGLHDYFTVIDRPMDLGTIKERLGKGFYTTPEEFASDIRLTFNNAFKYNCKGHDVHTFAGQYLALFERWFKPILAKYESEKAVHLQYNPVKMSNKVEEDVMIVEKVNSWSKFPSPEPVKTVKQAIKPDPKPPSPPPPPPVTIPEVVPVVATTSLDVERRVGGEVRTGRKPEGKLPKLRAKDHIKREMSIDEKKKLGLELQNLPPEKMSQVLYIVSKRNGDLVQDGDEIELDFEVLDNETLWELDRFVGNFNKTVSKMRRQGLMNGSQTNNGGHIDDTYLVGASDMMEEKSSKMKKAGGGVVDVGEEDVDIGDEMPVNNFPPLEIDKDDEVQHSGTSVSTSSRSDDSSSSDSDTGSSSGSDSDVDDAQSHDESKTFHQ